MKRILLISTFFIVQIAVAQKQRAVGFVANKGQIVDQNGQTNSDVKYLLNTNGLNVQLRQNGFSYDVYEIKKTLITDKHNQAKVIPDAKDPAYEDYNFETKFHRIDIDFVGCNPNAILIPEGISKDFDNYYNIPAAPQGILEVHRFQKVTYQNIYPDIDVVFFVPADSSKPVEYNFIVRPNGNIADIQMKFDGAKTDLSDNKIKLKVRFGEMEETLPLSWTEDNKKEVGIKYKKISKNLYGFDTNENISGKKVIIDPVPNRLWGTYFGGSGNEFPGSLNIDSNNNSLISGSTGSSNNIATAGPNTSGYTSGGGFIAKFDPNGTLIWSSYYPFSVFSLKLDNNNNMYTYGNVLNANANIPSPGCFQPIKNSYNDGFLIKLNAAGAKLWGTYYGGDENDYVNNVTFDSNYNVYIVGETNSNVNFTTPGAHLTVKPSPGNNSTAFAARFDPNGNRIWGTYYGGSGADGFFTSEISADGYLYAIGTSRSMDGVATPGAYQTTVFQTGGMIVKFDLNGNRVWGTYITNSTYLITGKLQGDAFYLYGRAFSDSSAVATPGTMYYSFQTLPPSSRLSSNENYYICKFNVQTQQLVWGTYFVEYISGMDVDSSNNVFFSGYTGIDTGLTTPDAYMPTKSFYQKTYLIKLNPSGQKVWGTYYGGNAAEQFGTVRIDHNNDIYLYGVTNGSTTGIATAGAHQTTLGSNPDTYLVKFRDCLSTTVASSNNPCIGGTINLTASGGTGYSWTGPNGFISSQQNPSITGATAAQSGLYSCAITGSGGCDNSITVNVMVGDNTKPVPDAATLSTITGDCNTVISVPTATDNCAGNINGITTTPVNYPLPGNYTFIWTYNDGNGNTETQTQDVIISAVSLPTVSSPQKFCIQQNGTLNDIAISGTSIKWYDAATGGNLLTNNIVLTDATTYYVSQSVSGCESLRVPVTIQIQNTPAPTGTNQSFCAVQNATLNDIVITGTAIKWYADATTTTELASTTILADNTTYYATQTINGCESTGRLPITITLISTLNATNGNAFICDNQNDVTEVVDLSLLNYLMASLAGNTFSYYATFNSAENLIVSEQLPTNHTISLGQTIVYVRIDNTNGCHQVVELELTLVSIPVITMPDEYGLCETGSVNITAPPGFDLYAWSTNVSATSITVNQAGNYWLMVGNSYGNASCTTRKDFSVILSNAPNISSIDIEDWTDTENSITINLSASSVGTYEYSIDGEHFQDSNTFTGLRSGEYTITVRDKKGCGIAVKQIYLLNYPKFFTPNSDGYNDNWRIKFSTIEPNFNVKIFDRYGKLLKWMNTSEAWDGTYNGKLMPADDYWFVATRQDGTIHKGHFAMKR